MNLGHSRNQQWDRVYARWKTVNPTAKPDTRARLVRGCRGKLAHTDILSAMKAANSLLRDYPQAKVSVYHCDLCHMGHMGRYAGKPLFPELREKEEKQ